MGLDINMLSHPPQPFIIVCALADGRKDVCKVLWDKETERGSSKLFLLQMLKIKTTTIIWIVNVQSQTFSCKLRLSNVRTFLSKDVKEGVSSMFRVRRLRA